MASSKDMALVEVRLAVRLIKNHSMKARGERAGNSSVTHSCTSQRLRQGTILVSLKCCIGTARSIRILLHFGDISNSRDETWEIRWQIEDNSGQYIFKKHTYWARFESCIQNLLSSCEILRTRHFFFFRFAHIFSICTAAVTWVESCFVPCFVCMYVCDLVESKI